MDIATIISFIFLVFTAIAALPNHTTAPSEIFEDDNTPILGRDTFLPPPPRTRPDRDMDDIGPDYDYVDEQDERLTGRSGESSSIQESHQRAPSSRDREEFGVAGISGGRNKLMRNL